MAERMSVAVSLPKVLVEQLDKKAEAMDATRSRLVARAIREWLERADA